MTREAALSAVLAAWAAVLAARTARADLVPDSTTDPVACTGKGGIAGVVGAGAGFPAEVPPRPGMPFAYFGAVGDEDFNFAEMRALDRRLDDIGTPHRVVVFGGGHRWPPPEVAGEALEWLEACASLSCPPEPPASKETLKRRKHEAQDDARELRAIAEAAVP